MSFVPRPCGGVPIVGGRPGRFIERAEMCVLCGFRVGYATHADALPKLLRPSAWAGWRR